MSSSCSTRAPNTDFHICALCEKATAKHAIEIPDTPEKFERAQRCQAQGWKVQRGDGTILAILCTACVKIVKMQRKANDEADEAAQAEEEEKMLQQAIEASIKTASTNEADDDDDEVFQRVLALTRQDMFF